LDAKVHALAARRAVHVRGIAGEEYRASTEGARDAMVDPELRGPREFFDPRTGWTSSYDRA
jgi:hypothetical protein